MTTFSKWVSCWGNATSITDRKESTYARDLTLRYPIRMCFSGSKIRMRFSNLTGTEPVTLTSVAVSLLRNNECAPTNSRHLTFAGEAEGVIPPGKEIVSDELPLSIEAGDTLVVSIYLGEFTQMNAGTLITGPLSKGQYAYGNFADEAILPRDLTRNTNWFYFLNTIDIFTEADNFALICFGDSITAQSWPDYLSIRAVEEDCKHVAVIRRAVSGTRILRQYDCITYQAYGLKGATRFPIEIDSVSGARAAIIQHGINDIIHPVGEADNCFRPWSDLPTVRDLCDGVEQLYINHARARGLSVWSATLLPILGWRTYLPMRETMRQQFNDWLRSSSLFDGCVDFDQAVRDAADPRAFAPGFDSGDHLHPSEQAYAAMAAAVPLALLR